MVVTDDGEDVFYKLPGAKKRQAKNKHNLMDERCKDYDNAN